MNTSAEILANVYDGCDMDEHRATASEMMRIYGKQNLDEEENSAEIIPHGHTMFRDDDYHEDDESSDGDRIRKNLRLFQSPRAGAHYSLGQQIEQDDPIDTRARSTRDAVADRTPYLEVDPQQYVRFTDDNRTHGEDTGRPGSAKGIEYYQFHGPRGRTSPQRCDHYRRSQYGLFETAELDRNFVEDTRKRDHGIQRRITLGG
jgi:hypothetical protein